MLFNSLLFLLFFIIVSISYYLLPHKFRWLWLLSASAYFYMYFKPSYILIILFTIIIDFFAGILIEKTSGTKKRIYLVISLIANIGVLVFYKYFDFLIGNLNFVLSASNISQIPLFQILLPIGLSFHTFQAMSYTIEVYRGKQKAEKHFGIYSLYVMFYPQMVAGPIERPQHILPQLKEVHHFIPINILNGLFFIAIGLFKKVAIADHLGLFVDPIFNDPHSHSALSLLTANYFFAIQIYCDFSGYSDMAIGTALVLGIKLMKNFDAPYLSITISEFWKRWHISLSFWFKDYLYIPMGGNRKGLTLTCLNLLIVFLISGLWHGANWKYLVWGALHGIFLIVYQIINHFNIKVNGYVFFKWLLTFNLVCLTWIFFRANSVTDGFYILSKIVSFNNEGYLNAFHLLSKEIIFCIILIAGLLSFESYFRKKTIKSNTNKLLITIILLLSSYFLGVFNEEQFIYFQF